MKRPIVWAAALWTAGSGLACAMPSLHVPLVAVAAAAGLLAGCLLLRMRGRQVMASLLIVCAAWGYFRWADSLNHTVLPASIGDGSAVVVSGTIVSPVEADGDRVTFVMKANRVESDGLSAPLGRTEKLQATIRLLRQEEQEIADGWKRGDEAVITGTLQVPSEARNFGAFDYRSYLRRQHIHWLVSAKGTDAAEVQTAGFRWSAAYLLRYSDRLRDWLGDRIDVLFPASQAGYMKGLLIGLRDDFDPEQYARFSRLGLTHVLAISGMHVAVFVGCLVWMLRRLGFTRETYLLTAMGTLPFYVVLTGASPSVIRAGLMTMLALYAARKHMLSDGLHLVCIVGWAMLLWNPYYLLDVGFQLSFLVTIGLIVGVSRVNGLLPIRNAALRGAIAVTIVSQLVSLPLTIYYFNQYSVVSWPANLLLVPLISLVVTPIGSVALLAGAAFPAVGGTLAWPVVWLNGLTFRAVEIMESWRAFQTVWPTPPVWWMFAYYGVLVLLLRVLERRAAPLTAAELAAVPPAEAGEAPLPYSRRSVPAIIGSVTAAALLLTYAFKPAFLQRGGMVQFLDVGQGDAILIRTPNGKHVLVDGGGTIVFRKTGEEWKRRANEYEVGAKLLVPLLKKRGVHRLDYVIASHEDADHIGGLQAVIEQMPVSHLLFNGTLKPGETAEKLFRTAIGRGIPLHAVQAGDVIPIGGETEIKVLYPDRAVTAPGQQPAIERETEQNAVSIVFLLAMSGAKLLFTGDMEQAAEDEVLRSLQTGVGGASTSIDVLKVAHHGSKTSTGDDWLDFWQPRLAVISVGQRNSYGHPSPVVTERLARHEIMTQRTDRDGEVQIRISRSGELSVRTKLQE